MKLRSMAALSAMVLAASAGAQTFSPDRVRADVAFLADDLLEGRGTGTRGYDIAAKYVAARFEALGLSPAGSGGWYQQIPFITATNDPAMPSAITIAGERMTVGDHFLVGPTPVAERIDQTVEAVFVGYGLQDKALGIDDYRGLDVRGKVVVTLSGTPANLPSDVAATLADKKSDVADALGAVGTLTISTPRLESTSPWERSRANNGIARMRWVHPDGRPEIRNPRLVLGGRLSKSATEKLLAGTPLAGGKLEALLKDPNARPKGFALPGKIRFERYSVVDKASSANVLGLLPGSDPVLSKEVVMLSAHLDHLGMIDAKTGDRVMNGAMDNAAGIATMLEAARAFIDSGLRPKRSILFVALTGEEKGLFGSEYLAAYPLPAGRRLVANVNLDMPILTYDFEDVIAFGAEHSTLGEAVGAAAAKAGIALSPDPIPEQQLFVRSDHYSFVQKGVPSVFLVTGFKGPGKQASTDFEDKRYHAVNDDLTAPFDWQAGAKFARVNYLIARQLADAAEAPRWYAGNYFGDKFAPDAPRAAKR